MKHITNNYTLYTFNELSFEAQKRAIKDYQNNSHDLIGECIQEEIRDEFEYYLKERGYSKYSQMVDSLGNILSYEKTWDGTHVGGIVNHIELQSVIDCHIKKGTIGYYPVYEMRMLIEFGLLFMEINKTCGKVEAHNWVDSISVIAENDEAKYKELRDIVFQIEDIVNNDLAIINEALRITHKDVSLDYNSEAFAASQLENMNECFLENGEFFAG